MSWLDEVMNFFVPFLIPVEEDPTIRYVPDYSDE